MPLDADAAAAPTLATINAPRHPLGTWRAFRAARRNVLEIVPIQAYREPIVLGRRWKMIMDPPAIEHVLKTRARDYPRSDVTLRLLRPTEGESLFTADWDDWRWQHRAMAPIFQRKRLESVANVMTASAEAVAARLDHATGGDDAAVDVYPEMVAATFDVINDAALSGRESLDRGAMAAGITRFLETVARVSLLDILGAPNWIPRPARLFTRTAERLDAMIDAVIAARLERGPAETEDLLDLLIAAEDPESGRRMSAVELRNNLMAFIVAGHETTALALTWALYLLAEHPEAQATARAEAQAALSGRAATAADLEALPYLRAVIDEAMRLYPPAAFLSRTAKAADSIAGRPVEVGETIMIPTYALHRHQMLWERPDAFDPDRFAPEAAAGRHRYAYLPFGAGPRICLGMSFALIEAVIILGTLIDRFSFEPTPGFEPTPTMILTLRPKNGMRLRVSPAR